MGVRFGSAFLRALPAHSEDPLVLSNASYLLVALAHYSYGRVWPCVMYVAIAYVGANYHTRCHILKKFDKSGQRWQTLDLLLSQVGFLYNWCRVVVMSIQWYTLIGSILCIVSVFFWLRAGRWWTQNCPTLVSQYKKDHATWHILSALGATLIAKAS